MRCRPGTLALVAQEPIDGRTRLHFKNISAKDLNGFVLCLDNLTQIEFDTTTGDRVIVPGEVQDIESPGPLPTITILAVMYADGSLEGDQITIAHLRNTRSALKSELKRFKLYDAPQALNAEARRDRIAFLTEQLKLKPLPARVIDAIPDLFQPPQPN